MVKIPVYLRDMYDAKHLVQIAESCRGDVDLLCGRYVVDAKSMLGVFSLPTFEQVEIGVGEEEAEFVREKLESLNLSLIRCVLVHDGRKKTWEKYRLW